jgi:hypothetical protein
MRLLDITAHHVEPCNCLQKPTLLNSKLPIRFKRTWTSKMISLWAFVMMSLLALLAFASLMSAGARALEPRGDIVPETQRDGGAHRELLQDIGGRDRGRGGLGGGRGRGGRRF